MIDPGVYAEVETPGEARVGDPVRVEGEEEGAMETAANVAVALIAALHLYFLVLEMFLWDKPFGRRVFRLTPEFSAATKSLAANQGLYNGFLAAGLLWGLALGAAGGHHVKVFFLSCVIVAGVFGAVTVNRNILFAQAVPGIVALAIVLQG